MSRELREQLIGVGLRLASDGNSHPVELTSAQVQSVCDSAAFEGLAALVGAAIEVGAVQCDAADTERVNAVWMERMAWCVQLDGVLIDVVARLAAAGIDTRVLKGAAVAMLDEPDPAWRSYGDVDVLVPRDALVRAADVLATAGWRPEVPPVSRRWAARHAKSLTLVDGSGVQVDLHRLLATGPLGDRVRSSALFDLGDPVVIGGHEVMALGRLHRFFHACYHASLGAVRGPRHDRDLLLLTAVVAPRDMDDEWANGWSETVIAAALQPLADRLPLAWRDWLLQAQ